jgi:deoxyribodipyrimidine photo-lyase
VNVVEKVKGKTVIYWYRKDLRVLDHPLNLLKKHANNVVGIYVFEEKENQNHRLGFPLVGKFRKTFVQQSIDDLKISLQSQEILLTLFHSIKEVPTSLFKEAFVLCFQELPGTEEAAAVAQMELLVGEENMLPIDNFTLVDKALLPFSKSNMPSLFTAFRKKVEAVPCFGSMADSPAISLNDAPWNHTGGETQALARI